MTDELKLSVDLGAEPERLYRAWLSSADHGKMTGGRALIVPRVGGKHTSWDGYICGETLELEEPRRIVQSWRTTEFPRGSDSSTLELTFEAIEGGTRLSLVHSNIPKGDGAKYEQGWARFYVDPMRAYFGPPTIRKKKQEVQPEAAAEPLAVPAQEAGPPAEVEPAAVAAVEPAAKVAKKKAAPKKKAKK